MPWVEAVLIITASTTGGTHRCSLSHSTIKPALIPPLRSDALLYSCSISLSDSASGFSGRSPLAQRVGWSSNDIIPAWSKHRGKNRYQQDASDDTQSHPHWQLVDVCQEHLGPHKDEDSRESVMEVVKELHHASQGKVERTESEDRKDIRGVHDKGIQRDGQNSRNRVHRKDDVRRFHHQQHNEQRCRGVLSALLNKKVVGVVAVCHRYQATEKLKQRILVRMDLFIFLHGHFDTG